MAGYRQAEHVPQADHDAPEVETGAGRGDRDLVEEQNSVATAPDIRWTMDAIGSGVEQCAQRRMHQARSMKARAGAHALTAFRGQKGLGHCMIANVF